MREDTKKIFSIPYWSKNRFVVLCLCFFLLGGPAFAATLNLNPTQSDTIRCDGLAGRCNAATYSWQQAHDATAPVNLVFSNDTLWSGFTSARGLVDRAGFSFDSTILGTTTITVNSASLWVYFPGTGTDNGYCNVGAVGFTPTSLSSYANTDFAQFGTTRFSADVTAAIIQGGAGYREFPLNASGLAVLNTNAPFGIGVRCASDIDNTDPGATVNYLDVEALMTDTHQAYIAVDYSYPTGSTSPPVATSTASTTAAYTGPDLQEWIFLFCVILFFISYSGWGTIGRQLNPKWS